MLPWLRLPFSDSGEVVNARSCAEVFAQPVGWVLAQCLADVRLRVVEIAEDARSGRANHNAGWGCIRVHAGGESQAEAAVDTLIAERAFLGHAARTSLHFGVAPFRHGWIFPGELFPVERACL